MKATKSENQSLFRRKQPALVAEEWIETDPKTGAKIRVSRNRRGVLGVEIRHFDSSNMQAWQSIPPRQALQNFCEHLRDDLEKSGLPSDRTPLWIRIGDGEWEPQTESNAHRRFKPPVGVARWWFRMTKMTEPLSTERLAGDLLYALTELLDREGIDNHLWHIAQTLQVYSKYRIAGRINYLAHQGLAAQKGRAAGPQATRKRAKDVRLVSCSQAESYWSCYPALRGDASNTAAKIAAAVNMELKSRGLLPPGRQGLSAKTIGDHIRSGIGG